MIICARIAWRPDLDSMITASIVASSRIWTATAVAWNRTCAPEPSISSSAAIL